MRITTWFQRAAALALMVAPACGSAAAPCALASLSWLAGSWRSADDPQGAQERWAVAPHDVLMGTAWEFADGKPGYAEIMTVRQDGDAIALVLRHFDAGLGRAWEERDAPMVFIASSCARGAVVFDGRGDRAGEHLTYRRDGASLSIVGEFLRHGAAHREQWHMILSGD